MKTTRFLSLRARYFFTLALTLLCALPGKAQMTNNGYANIDWQYKFPQNNHFADKNSGWGMNFEGGYFLTEHFSVGAFLSYHTLHEYIPRQTIPTSPNGSLTTDQQHTLFQLPFGVSGRYTWYRGNTFQPYVGIKAGTQYAKMRTDFSLFEGKEDTWGFYVSPEVGTNIYPWAYGPGLHVAVYYSYGSNHGNILSYDINGLSNFGLRIGIAF